jgi:hypothetical protein
MAPVVPVSVGTTATLIATTTSATPQTTWIHIDANSPVVYLGPNSSVTTSNGMPAGGGSDITLFQTHGATIYAIVAGPYGGTVKVSTNTS